MCKLTFATDYPLQSEGGSRQLVFACLAKINVAATMRRWARSSMHSQGQSSSPTESKVFLGGGQGTPRTRIRFGRLVLHRTGLTWACARVTG